MGLFTGQAFRLLDEVMKKEVRRTEGARENLPTMRAVIERLRRDENLSKPRSMDISSVAESECGEDSMSQWIWEQDWLAAGGSWEEEAAPEPGESLDAVGKGGKGKGKGKYGKGKGKGKGQGTYTEGTGGKGADKWVETRECHNCHRVGHLAC